MNLDIPLSLYIHFPWCVKKCPYCDFNSHSQRGELPERAYVDALIQDFRQQLTTLGERKIETIFMGGGTPSLISPKEIARLLTSIQTSGQLKADAEITLEANPGALDEGHLSGYRQAGVNRVSIGVQSFDDNLLQKIGRIHSASNAVNAVKLAKQAGFERINLDLMYGLPEQSLQGARDDLEQVFALDTEHLSVYQLTIEPNTEFAARTPILPTSDQYWQMHEQTQQLTQQAGFEQYEVSAYSRGGKEAQCKHNVNYWQFGDYLAIGAGAHGKLSGVDEEGVLQIKRYWNQRHPKAYLAAAETGAFSAETKTVLPAEHDFEFLMNALRLKQGFIESQYLARTQGNISGLMRLLKPFFEKGWLIQTDKQIYASTEGYRYLDSILMACLPEVSE